MNGWISSKIGICIDIDEILVGFVTHKFAQIYNRVVPLDLRQNFVSAQYLKNEWMELNKILHIV